MAEHAHEGGIFDATQITYEHEVLFEPDEFIHNGLDDLMVQHFYPGLPTHDELRETVAVQKKLIDAMASAGDTQVHDLAPLVSFDHERRTHLQKYLDGIARSDEFELTFSHRNREHMVGAVLIQHLEGGSSTLSGIFDRRDFNPLLPGQSMGFAKHVVESQGRSVMLADSNLAHIHQDPLLMLGMHDV